MLSKVETSNNFHGKICVISKDFRIRYFTVIKTFILIFLSDFSIGIFPGNLITVEIFLL